MNTLLNSEYCRHPVLTPIADVEDVHSRIAGVLKQLYNSSDGLWFETLSKY
jgi:hypothetical protein